jgi:hypothetical protein
MRKFLVRAAFVTVVLGSIAACAHPTLPEGYGPTTAGTAPTGPTGPTGPADQTKEVCTQAQSLSVTAVATIRTKAAAAQSALAAGNQVGVVQAVTDLKKAATDWSDQLTQLSSKPVKPAVKSVLDDGVRTINQLASATTPPPDAESKLTDFTTKLAAACA